MFDLGIFLLESLGDSSKEVDVALDARQFGEAARIAEAFLRPVGDEVFKLACPVPSPGSRGGSSEMGPLIPVVNVGCAAQPPDERGSQQCGLLQAEGGVSIFRSGRQGIMEDVRPQTGHFDSLDLASDVRSQLMHLLAHAIVPLMERRLAGEDAWAVGYFYKTQLRQVEESGRSDWIALWHRAGRWLDDNEVDLAPIGMSRARTAPAVN